MYDVTRRETFTNLSDIWAKEIDLYSTNQDCIKMLVGNKVDKVLLRINSKSCKLCLHLLTFLSDWVTAFIFYCPITDLKSSFWQESERAVTKKEGIEFAREYGCLFLECSAKTKVNVEQCFEELVLKVCIGLWHSDLGLFISQCHPCLVLHSIQNCTFGT